MKFKFIIFFCLISTLVNAKTYYIKNEGNDNANGESDATAWKSINKINSRPFSPGDSILFKRGDVWRMETINPYNGSSIGYIYYGAYGTGAKPLLLGSNEENDLSDWTHLGNNIWQNSDPKFTVDVGNIVFNNEQSCGIKIMSSVPTFTTQGQFWYDFTNNLIKMYSVGNPASFYTDIECCLSIKAVTMEAFQYVIFQNLDFRYWGDHVVYMRQQSNHNKFLDLYISYIGGMDMNSNYQIRYGNGIDCWLGSNDIEVSRCWIDQCYDAAVSPQAYENTYTIYNWYVRNNIISRCEYGFEFFIRSPGTANNIYVENNTFIDGGMGFGHRGGNGHHMQLSYLHGATISDIYIRNNIYYKSLGGLVNLKTLSDWDNLVMDYNLYYTTTNQIARTDAISYSTLSAWQAASGMEAHSIVGDPSFISSTNLKLRSNSPAIDKGINVGLPYNGLAPDLGTYEFSDLDNNPPSISNNGFQLLRNSPNGTVAGTIIASDPEVGQTLYYSIVSGNTNGAFVLNALTGELSVANSDQIIADFELVVKVQDDGIPTLSSEATITIDVTGVGIELIGNNRVEIYPNPISNELIIEIEGNYEKSSFEILNSSGQIVSQGKLSEKTVVQTSKFPIGVYIIKLHDGKSFLFKKIIKY